MPPKVYAAKDLGVLTPTTFRDYVRFTGGKTVIQHFRVLDINGDGELTLKEFVKGVRTLGYLNATAEECEFVFKWLDDDGSGILPYPELDKKLRKHPVLTEAEAAKEAEAALPPPPPPPPPPTALKLPINKLPAPKALIAKLRGNERWLRPTFAATGMAHLKSDPKPDPPAGQALHFEVVSKKPPRPLKGDEGFMQKTIGTASLTDHTGTLPDGPYGPYSHRFTDPAAEAPNPAPGAESNKARLSPDARQPFGSPDWRPTIPKDQLEGQRSARRRPPLWEEAERAAEERRQEEAEYRDRVRRAAERQMVKAQANPMEVKFGWMQKFISNGRYDDPEALAHHKKMMAARAEEEAGMAKGKARKGSTSSVASTEASSVSSASEQYQDDVLWA